MMGFEHSIANLFLLPLGAAAGAEASLTRVLEEALPLFIARKQAFHLLLKQAAPP